jgi:carbamoyltransferase
MTILGLGGLLRDAACAVLQNGKLIAAAEELKLARRVNPGQIPDASITECLKFAGVARDKVDCVAIARPFAYGRETQFHLALRAEFPNSQIVVVEHHAAHAASAYYASGFDDATVLTFDRSGDFRCGARWHGSGAQMQLDKEWYYPDSLGRLYGAVTELLGFNASADEHKVQWLSAYGDTRFVPLFREIISAEARIEPRFFDGNRMRRGGFSAEFYERLGIHDGAEVQGKLRASVAAGLQRVIEERVIEMAGTGTNLCLAGGLFYNALLVRALESCGRWQRVFVQPASGNAGTALGAAYWAAHQVLHQPLNANGTGSLLLGPEFTQEEVKRTLENCKLRFRYVLTNEDLIEAAVNLLAENRIVAWMQGRMEFGPRALGNRSILASPLDPYSTENLNVYIKHREPFRKFAASVPAEHAATYFEAGENARNLATVGRVREEYRKTFEGAVLGDDLVRVHVVDKNENPLYHRLLEEAGRKLGLPVLYNTSFNLFGDPLVATPRDAVRSFYSSGIDALLAGHFIVEK